MDELKHVIVGNCIGLVLVIGAALGIFGATLGMCSICTLGLLYVGG